MRRALAVALLVAAPAAAQDRPREDDLFGSPPAQEEPRDPGPRVAPRDGGEPRAPPAGNEPLPPRAEAPLEPESEPGALSRLGARLAETEDTLRIGGQLYLRAFGFSRLREAPSRWQVSAPSLADLYLDARPNDRVRAFALVRTQYDPTVDEDAAGPLASLDLELDTGEPLAIPGARPLRTTEVDLDQLWLRFDVGRRAFLTLGKQHVKWGVGRFWNPTDFLHAVRRDPLATFDARTGTTMARVHVPWEERGWNFHAALVLEPLVPAGDAGAPAAGQLGALGLAGRAEIVLGTAEVGVGAVAQKGRPSRLGLDVSAGVWELDVYGELALRTAPEFPLWREADASLPLVDRFERFEPGGPNPSATLGASWSWRYSDEDSLTLGAEYAYNRNGYGDAKIYPWLLLNDALAAVPGAPVRTADVRGDFNPFYLGRNYAGVFLALPSPGSWNDASFTFSTLGNLSDGSFVSRVDGSLSFLTHLRLEAFVAGHYGRDEGEFRLGLDLPAFDTGIPLAGGTLATPAVRVGAPLVDVGVALRVAL